MDYLSVLALTVDSRGSRMSRAGAMFFYRCLSDEIPVTTERVAIGY